MADRCDCVVDLPRSLSLQRHAGQVATRDCSEILQPRCQSANAVEARGSEYKAAQLIAVANTHVQAAVGLAMAHAKPACIRTRAGQLFQTFVCHTLAALAIADAQRASGTAIEHAVITVGSNLDH